MIPIVIFILIAAIIYEIYYIKKTYREGVDFWRYLTHKTKHKEDKRRSLN